MRKPTAYTKTGDNFTATVRKRFSVLRPDDVLPAPANGDNGWYEQTLQAPGGVSPSQSNGEA